MYVRSPLTSSSEFESFAVDKYSVDEAVFVPAQLWFEVNHWINLISFDLQKFL